MPAGHRSAPGHHHTAHPRPPVPGWQGRGRLPGPVCPHPGPCPTHPVLAPWGDTKPPRCRWGLGGHSPSPGRPPTLSAPAGPWVLRRPGPCPCPLLVPRAVTLSQLIRAVINPDYSQLQGEGRLPLRVGSAPWKTPGTPRRPQGLVHPKETAGTPRRPERPRVPRGEPEELKHPKETPNASWSSQDLCAPRGVLRHPHLAGEKAGPGWRRARAAGPGAGGTAGAQPGAPGVPPHGAGGSGQRQLPGLLPEPPRPSPARSPHCCPPCPSSQPSSSSCCPPSRWPQVPAAPGCAPSPPCPRCHRRCHGSLAAACQGRHKPRWHRGRGTHRALPAGPSRGSGGSRCPPWPGGGARAAGQLRSAGIA